MFIGRKRYAVIERIAVGGQAIVYKAEDTLLRRSVAVKLLLQQLALVPETRDRFLREAQALASIDHPNIVQLLDIDQLPDGSYFVVQQLLEGETLRDRMDKKPALSRQEAVDSVVIPIMGALVAAHGKGIIHRDVKPDNIILVRTPSNDQIPKLIDFGIAKVMGERKPGLTRLGIAMGTPGYMAPEQIRDARSAGAPADVWAVGMLLFELFTGRLPFEGDVGTLIDRTANQPVPRVDTIAPDVPSELVQMIKEALDYDPEKRPSMRALRSRLLALRMRPGSKLASPTIIGGFSLPEGASGDDAGAASARAQSLNEKARRMCASSPEIEVIDEDSAALDEDPTVPFSSKDRRLIAAAPPLSALGLNVSLDPEGIGEIALSDDPRVNRLLDEAIRALGMNALEGSLAYVDRALLIGSPGDERMGGVKLVAAIAHHWLGNFAEAERFADGAVKGLSRGSDGWYTAVGYLATALGDRGNAKELHALLRDLKSADAAVSPAWAIASCRLVQCLVRTGFPGPARQLLATVMRRASERGIAGMALVRAWISVAQSSLDIHRGDVMRHLGSVALAIDAFGEGRDVRSACLQRVNAGNAYMQLGGHAEAEAELRAVLRVAEPMHLRFVPALKVNLGFALARLNRLDEALAMESGAVEQCKKQGNRRFESVGRLYLANILLRREDAPGAARAAEEAIACAKDFPGLDAYARAMLGSIYLRQSKPKRALSAAEGAMELLIKLQSLEEGEALIRVVDAEALYASGRREEAIARIHEARERLLKAADEIDDPHWRRSFLENVPENARTMRFAAKWGLGDAEDDTAVR
jgi:serine/threonine protein kinase